MHLNVRVIHNSGVLAGILALQKPMDIPKTRLAIHNAVLVITALAAYNPHHPEQSLHISYFASNICLLRVLKLTVFGYCYPNTSIYVELMAIFKQCSKCRRYI